MQRLKVLDHPTQPAQAQNQSGKTLALLQANGAAPKPALQHLVLSLSPEYFFRMNLERRSNSAPHLQFTNREGGRGGEERYAAHGKPLRLVASERYGSVFSFVSI